MSRGELGTLLYVDDEADIREIVRLALSVLKTVRVHSCESGEVALAALVDWKPDLVLLDVMMPTLDGPATLSRMRESDLGQNVPVIFMTAKALPHEVARFRQLGAIGVIEKPFDPVKLSGQVLSLWQTAPVATDVLQASHELQGGVERLGMRFLQRTRQDVVWLYQLLEGVQAGQAGTLKQLERLAHSIRGVGAALGFPEVSECARDIERLAESSAGKDAMLNPSVTRRLAFDTARLSGMIEKLIRQPGSN